MNWRGMLVLAVALGGAGCEDEGPSDVGTAAPDAEVSIDDAAVAPDGATVTDAGAGDAAADASAGDAETHDFGVFADAAIEDAAPLDAMGGDAGPLDAGADDAALRDAAPVDMGFADAGFVDGGFFDAGVPDSGPVDAGASWLLTVGTSTGGIVLVNNTALCPAMQVSCQSAWLAGTQVTLTASAAVGFTFQSWTGDCAGAGASTSLIMDRDRACFARFLGVGGQVALVPAPASVVPHATEDPVNILVFEEQVGLTLPAGVPFDVQVPDTYDSTPENLGELPAGLTVDVYFLHFDPPGTATTNRQATLTFPGRIVALITRTGTLNLTDGLLGIPSSVTYPTGTAADRGLEAGGQDPIVLYADRRRLGIDFRTSTVNDQIRIVTISPTSAVPPFASRTMPLRPAPASVALGATQSSTVATFFLEQSQVVLTTTVALDISVPGAYASANSLTFGTLPPGTRVSTYLLHVDPVSGTRSIEVSAVLDRPILGFVGQAASLDATDALGAPGTSYPTGTYPGRAMEWGADWVRWSDEPTSFRARFEASTGTDDLRIFVAE